MGFSINKVTIGGNVARDPELRYTQSGEPICNFTVVTSKSRKQEGGTYTDLPSFHRVVVWGKMGEWLGSHVKKGAKITVFGELKYGKYEKDGVTHYTTDIIGQDFVIGSRGNLNPEEGGDTVEDGGQGAYERLGEDNAPVDVPADFGESEKGKKKKGEPENDDIPF